MSYQLKGYDEDERSFVMLALHASLCVFAVVEGLGLRPRGSRGPSEEYSYITLLDLTLGPWRQRPTLPEPTVASGYCDKPGGALSLYL